MKKKINNYILIVPFMFSIFSISILNKLKPDTENSFIENRTLATEPTFSLDNVKKFTTDYEKYFSDQFIGREKLLTTYIDMQIKLNKSVVQNVYINNDWLLGIVDTFKTSDLDAKAQTVIDLKNSSEDKNFYYFSVPHKASALSHLYPVYDTSVATHAENKNYLIDKLNTNGVAAFNLDTVLKSKFSEKELESMYYKTDHHWNGYGAYNTTKDILAKLGVEVDESLYEILEVSNKDFLGSYNRKLGSLFSKKEVLSYIKPSNVESFELFANQTGTLKKVNPSSYLSVHRDKDETTYGGFYQGDLPYLKIVNENSLTDRKLLIVRDSYQAPTTLMFSSIFREVEIVDDRHISKINKTLDDIISSSEADDVIFFKYL